MASRYSELRKKGASEKSGASKFSDFRKGKVTADSSEQTSALLRNARARQTAMDLNNAREAQEEQARVTDKYGSNEQRLMSEKARESAMTQQAELERRERRDADPSRKIPVIGDVLRGLDKFADATKPAADVAQTLYTPGAGLGALNAGTRGAGALVSRIAPGLGGSLLGRVGKVAATEAIVGAPTGLGQVLANNPQASNRELAEGTVLGAAGGAALGGLGKLASEGIQAGVKAVLRPALEAASREAEPIIARKVQPGGSPEPNTQVQRIGGLAQVVPESTTPTEPRESVLLSSAGKQPEPIKLDQKVLDFNAQDVGDASTFRGKVSRDINPRKKSFSQRIEQLRAQTEDDVIPFAGLEKRVSGKVGEDAKNSLYKSARLFKGVSEKAGQVVKDRLTPIISNVEKAGYSSDDLGDYALAMHARDVNNAGLKSGYTNKEINDAIAKYENVPELEEARQQLVKINNDMLDELVNSGMHSPALRDTLRDRWKNYLPLFRSFEDDPEAFASGLSQSLASIGDPIKRLKGSERKVIDPLENMVKNIFQSVTAAERNKVKLQLSELSKADPEESFIRKLGENEQVGKKNVITVRENGDNVQYEVEPEVFKAFNSLDQEGSNMLMNVLAAPASLLRAGATLTPDFALRNPFRDIVQAFITSKSGFNPVVDFPIGLYQTITKGKYYKDWVDNLGAFGNSLSMDRNAHKEALQKVIKQPVSKHFVNVVSGRSLIKLLRTISDYTESATKVGEYRKGIKKGVSPQEAAYRARDLMDFARSGSSIRSANRIVAFLNANIQGKSKLLRAIKENPARTTARMISGVTIPTVGIFAWNHFKANETQRQTIDESPDWLKDSFWLVAIPGTDKVARIPKPFDVAPVFANLPERVLDSIYRDHPTDFDDWAKRSLTESALPMQITGLIPLIEGMSGYSFFREGSIVPEREQGLQLKDQYDPVRTTEVAKLLSSAMSKLTGDEGPFKNFSSPRIMDNTIKGVTAGLGTYATDAIDAILQKTGAVDRPVSPEKRAEQSPFLRSFLVDPLGSSKSMEEMYREKEKLSRKEESASLRAGEDATPTTTIEGVTEKGNKSVRHFFLPQAEAERLNTLNDTTKKISGISAEIRSIEADRKKTAKQKRDEIEPLLAERNRLAIEVMKNSK